MTNKDFFRNLVLSAISIPLEYREHALNEFEKQVRMEAVMENTLSTTDNKDNPDAYTIWVLNGVRLRQSSVYVLKELLKAKLKFQAIKYVRILTGSGIVDAKLWVEEFALLPENVL